MRLKLTKLAKFFGRLVEKLNYLKALFVKLKKFDKTQWRMSIHGPGDLLGHGGLRGCACFPEFGHFSCELKGTESLGGTESEV